VPFGWLLLVYAGIILLFIQMIFCSR